MPKLSIIIPSRNELSNLCFTLQGIMNEFLDTGIDYEVIAVLNLCSDQDHESLKKFTHVLNTGRLKVLRYDEKPSCWGARQFGVDASQGSHLMFLDSHVLPYLGAYRGAYEYIQTFDGALHLGVNTFLNVPWSIGYQYVWQPNKFWGAWTHQKPDPPDYHILSSGFAGTLYPRHVWDEIGGLNPHFRTYGGAECYLDLKAWMFGFEVRCHPDYALYHLALRRGYQWSNDDVWFNGMLAAHIIAGSEAVDLVHARYAELCNDVPRYLKKLGELRMEAEEAAALERKRILKCARYSADEILGRQFVLKKTG